MRKAHVRWYLGGAAGLGAALFGAGLVMLNPFMLGDPRVMFELYALGNRYPAQYALIAVALFAVGSAVLLSYFFYENRFYDDMKCNEDEELYDRLYGQHKQLIDGIRREAFNRLCERYGIQTDGRGGKWGRARLPKEAGKTYREIIGRLYGRHPELAQFRQMEKRVMGDRLPI